MHIIRNLSGGLELVRHRGASQHRLGGDTMRIDNGSLQKRVTAPLMDLDPIISVCAVEALNAGWAELWYQPIFDAQTRQIAGVEGLARVRHPIWGILSTCL